MTSSNARVVTRSGSVLKKGCCELQALKENFKNTSHTFVGALTSQDLNKMDAAVPRDRYMHATSAANGRMYVFGGNSGQACNDVWRFDLASDTWEAIDLQGEGPDERTHATLNVVRRCSAG